MAVGNFVFKGDNGQDIFCWYWSVDTEEKGTVQKGTVQIVHGMAEHAGRYADLAGYLNNLGFAVYACDLRGHGRTGELNHNSGGIDNDGFNGIIKDQNILTGLIRAKHPGSPLFILGHSFGSFIVQEYIKRYGSEIEGSILSATCRMQGPAILAGLVIAVLSLPFGKSRPNILIDKMSFGSFNKGIPNPKSKFDWISRDPQQVKRYIDDKYCGGVMSSNFFYYFFKGLRHLNDNMGAVRRDLPVYMISGDKDPVGLYGAGVRRLYDTYGSLGIEDLQMKLYPGGRHESINETNRQEVYGDIGGWLLKHIKQVQEA